MQPVMVYIVSDGKRGHLAQSRGLAQAIGRRIPTRTMEIDSDGKREAPQPPEDGGVILAAGSATHSLALSLRKYLGVPAVCLMNPGLIDRQRFDLCVIPWHDGVNASNSVVITEGALNVILRAIDSSPKDGLILVGGPSKHHGWDPALLVKQIETLLQHDVEVSWTATDSRRTPRHTSSDLLKLSGESAGRLKYKPAIETPEGWVAEQLQRCGICWVSEDSVSMVYEALTAGAGVGLLSVPKLRSRAGRVVRGMDSLVEKGWVVTHAAWQQGKALPVDRPGLAEADRVASIIIKRWFSPTEDA
ncbi:MAG: ELM1/GtrOC1 family putative glycosyltransferase [Planctomycetota bacterium]